MSDELRSSPVVDLDALLTPISEENPSGESLRYSGVYDEIAEARRADDDLGRGEWQTELKVADFRKVIGLAVPALSTQAKDLQIAAWLSEALIKEHGFPGLRDSLSLLAGLQDRFWGTLHPEIEDGDMDGRANAIAWFESQASFAIQTVAITGGPRYSYLNWEDSKRFEFPENIDTLDTAEQTRINQLKAQAENERRVTGDMWRKAAAATTRRDCEVIEFAIAECWEGIAALNTAIETHFDRNQMPSLNNLQKALENVHAQAKKLLEQKRAEEPDAADTADEAETSSEGTGNGAAAGIALPAGAIQNRKDALKRLNDIADYFQKTEPHSPVSYLVTRAVRWGNMPLESWLQDVIKDETVLFNLRQTLGFNTVPPDNGQPNQ